MSALPLPEVRRPDARPHAVAVLEDWLVEHIPKWSVDPKRDLLEVCRAGVLRGAPVALVEQASEATWTRWEEDTEPVRLLRLLNAARGRGTVGRLWGEHLLSARRAHREALLLVLERGVPVANVRTWAVGGRYGCGSDEVRFRGASVTVHRRARVTEDSRQAILWPVAPGADLVGEDWYRDGSYLRRDGAQWRQA